MAYFLLFFFLVCILLSSLFFYVKTNATHIVATKNAVVTPKGTIKPTLMQNPLAIKTLQDKSYPGSALKLERIISRNNAYTSYIASFTSDYIKQYGLLTIPLGTKPIGGWPVILFNHGYIPPDQYDTVTSYTNMILPLASAGFIVFKPDYRGNGLTDGKPEQVYISPGYIIDSMNALSSVKNYHDANPNKIALVGHSMGGKITLHELVIVKNVKAAVIIGGVVGDISSLVSWWDTRNANKSIVGNDLETYFVLKQMEKKNGLPNTNPTYWDSIDVTRYLNQINAPIFILVGSNDTAVPPVFSEALYKKLQTAKKQVTYKKIPGADHNLQPVLQQNMNEIITFLRNKLQ